MSKKIKKIDDNSFKGIYGDPIIFDGNGKNISGLYINSTSDDQGLFGCVSLAVLQNISIVNSFIKTTGNNVGGVFGKDLQYGNTYVINCKNYGVIKGASNVGGICGAASTGSIFTTCTNSGNIIGTGNAVGGICGAASNTTSTNCTNSGNITGAGDEVGGICGYAYSATFTSCNNDGDITGNSYVGGIYGMDYFEGCSHSDCHNYGTITGKSYFGDIVGGVYD